MSENLSDLRRSVPEGIAVRIREQILSGALRPGERLPESELTARFDASRNTVRDALLRLVNLGLVSKNPHRGCAVIDPTRDELAQIMDFRQVVEPGAVRIIVRSICVGRTGKATRATPAAAAQGRVESGLARLESLAKQMAKNLPEKMAKEGGIVIPASGWQRYGELDYEFHRSMVGLAGGPRLAVPFGRAIRSLYLPMLISDRAAAARPHSVSDGARDSGVSDHGYLVELLRSGEETQALELIDRHLENARNALIGTAGS